MKPEYLTLTALLRQQQGQPLRLSTHEKRHCRRQDRFKVRRLIREMLR